MKTLTYAIRFLSRSKAYTIINLLGLAFSLACCIILMRYIHRELTVDDFEGKERIFIVTNEYESRQPNFGNIDGYGSKPFTDEQGHSAIEASADFHILNDDFIMKDERKYNCQTMIVSDNFLDILPFQLISGKKTMESPRCHHQPEVCPKIVRERTSHRTNLPQLCQQNGDCSRGSRYRKSPKQFRI